MSGHEPVAAFCPTLPFAICSVCWEQLVAAPGFPLRLVHRPWWVETVRPLGAAPLDAGVR